LSHLYKLFQESYLDLCHTLREGNSAVDCLAKLGVKSYEKLVLLNTAPPDLSSMLLDDALDISSVRH